MNASPIIHPNLLTELTPNFYPGLCTLQTEVETQSDTGAVVLTWTNITGLVDLPCRLVAAGAGSAEIRTPDQILTVGVYVCDIPQLVTGVNAEDRAVVDTVAYDILAVESDGERPAHSTKLTLKLVT